MGAVTAAVDIIAGVRSLPESGSTAGMGVWAAAGTSAALAPVSRAGAAVRLVFDLEVLGLKRID